MKSSTEGHVTGMYLVPIDRAEASYGIYRLLLMMNHADGFSWLENWPEVCPDSQQDVRGEKNKTYVFRAFRNRLKDLMGRNESELRMHVPSLDSHTEL